MRVVSESFRGIAMVEEIKLDFYSAYTATYLFLSSLRNFLKDKTSNEEREQFGDLICGAYNIPGWETDWEDANEECFKKKVDKTTRVSSKDCYNILIVFVKMFHSKFGYPCPFLINLLEQVRATPKNYPEEWKLWKRAASNASIGNYDSDGRED